jgi:hypothetical protein
MDNSEMKQYVGIKRVRATPMSNLDFRAIVRGEDVEDSDQNDEGYHVIYEDGYGSWSPKDVFEKYYLDILDGDFLAKDAINKVINDKRIDTVKRTGERSFVDVSVFTKVLKGFHGNKREDLPRIEEIIYQTLDFIRMWAINGVKR